MITIETSGIKLSCDNRNELAETLALITEHKLLFFPVGNARFTRVVEATEEREGDESEERALRDEYAREVGKGFSMKGKAGRAIDNLRAWKNGETLMTENEPESGLDLDTVPT